MASAQTTSRLSAQCIFVRRPRGDGNVDAALTLGSRNTASSLRAVTTTPDPSGRPLSDRGAGVEGALHAVQRIVGADRGTAQD
jgi:hypothetical protein